MDAMRRNTLRSIATAPSRTLFHPQCAVSPSQRRFAQNRSANEALDPLSEKAVKGRTGGGERLESSSPNAPPKPKVSNLSVPGLDDQQNLTPEQKAEVEEHNRDFETKHDRGTQAPDDLVDKKFWTGDVGRGTVKK